MVLFEDQECGVCYLHYSRIDRVPRTLHCNHTFCTPCLEAMGVYDSSLRTIRCPFCRQVTCVDRGLSLQQALFVNSQLWDNICDEQEDENVQEKEKEGKNTNMQVLPSSQYFRDCQVSLLNQQPLYHLIQLISSQNTSRKCTPVVILLVEHSVLNP
uniref:Im:7152348 n=1 Tax=Cyprinus carpio TaxID=7962 RepID=A0A8C2GT31_CYPCA